MCCLGVLTVGAAREAINATGYRVDANLADTGMEGRVGIHYPDRAAVARHDIPEALLPVVGLTKRQEDKLIQMNDGDGATFEDIANWIVKNIPSEDDNA